MHLGTPHKAARNTPEASEIRLRQIVSSTARQAKIACERIQRVVDEVGYDNLGHLPDVSEVGACYDAMRTLAVTLSPSLEIPKLVTEPPADGRIGRRRNAPEPEPEPEPAPEPEP